MMKDDNMKKSGVADISHMYVGPNQRASLFDKAVKIFMKKGYSFNQARALADQSVAAFLNEQRQKQVEAIRQAEKDGNDTDDMVDQFLDEALGPKVVEGLDLTGKEGDE